MYYSEHDVNSLFVHFRMKDTVDAVWVW